MPAPDLAKLTDEQLEAYRDLLAAKQQQSAAPGLLNAGISAQPTAMEKVGSLIRQGASMAPRILPMALQAGRQTLADTPLTYDPVPAGKAFLGSDVAPTSIQQYLDAANMAATGGGAVDALKSLPMGAIGAAIKGALGGAANEAGQAHNMLGALLNVPRGLIRGARSALSEAQAQPPTARVMLPGTNGPAAFEPMPPPRFGVSKAPQPTGGAPMGTTGWAGPTSAPTGVPRVAPTAAAKLSGAAPSTATPQAPTPPANTVGGPEAVSTLQRMIDGRQLTGNQARALVNSTYGEGSDIARYILGKLVTNRHH